MEKTPRAAGANRTRNPIDGNKTFDSSRKSPPSVRARTANEENASEPKVFRGEHSLGQRRVSLAPSVKPNENIHQTEKNQSTSCIGEINEPEDFTRKRSHSPRAERSKQMESDPVKTDEQCSKIAPRKPGLIQKAKSACRLERSSQIAAAANREPEKKRVPVEIGKMNRNGYIDSMVLNKGPALKLSRILSQKLNERLEAEKSPPTDTKHIQKALNEFIDKIYTTLVEQKSDPIAEKISETESLEKANQTFQEMIQDMHEQVALGEDVPIDRPIDSDLFSDTPCFDTRRFSPEEISFEKNKQLAFSWILEHTTSIINDIPKHKFLPDLFEKIFAILKAEMGTAFSMN